SSELKAGTYRLTSGMNPASVVEILVVGPSVDTFWITIPEGLRISEMLEHIASQSSLSVADLEAVLTSGSVTSTLRPSGAPRDLGSWEGLLFADTYQLARNWTASDVLNLLTRTMEERYGVVEWSDPRLEELEAYQRLVAASVIEAETRVDSDRPLVAAVILNRLEAGMPLQMDATVLYGLGVRGRGPTLDELEVDTPYNTYLHTGLPPTPIGAPGTASLEALANPADADYLYYVRTGLDGSHSFTANYDEFLRWKQEAEAKGLG
ncbi:MAG TPA: endolytic transglycosylase MltG, partial [Acidimicrobiia bacterium]